MRLALLLIFTILTATEALAFKRAPLSFSEAKETTETCTSNENWSFSAKIPEQWQSDFLKTLKDPQVILQMISKAEILRKKAKTAEGIAFTEYWIWRAAFDLKAYRLAYEGFSKLIASQGSKFNLSAGTFGIHLAALNCLNQIQKILPKIPTSEALVQGVSAMPQGAITAEFFSNRFLTSYRAGLGFDKLKLDKLRQFEPYENFNSVLNEAKKVNEFEVIIKTQRLLAPNILPLPLEPHRDALHLMAGHAYFGQGKYQLAAKEFRAVTSTSNLLPQALVGLAWSYLNSNQNTEAIGAAYNLFYGPLAKTFAPESSLVVAIAFIEYCQYPESLEAIDYFRKSYAPAVKWLTAWAKPEAIKKKTRNLYSDLAKYLKGDPSIPDRVGSEWLRSPIFISAQSELNEIVDEKKALNLIINSSKGTIQNLALKKIDTVKTRELELLGLINLDLNTRTEKMLADLSYTEEQIQLVEAEIYNAVGEQVIVDYAFQGKTPASFKPQNSKANKASNGLDWGRFPASLSQAGGATEMWEDELGFLKAEVKNRCYH